MKDKKWFSAKLSFAIMVEGVGCDIINNCIYLLSADQFSSAFQRAIQIGRSNEKNYKNADGKNVGWVFKEVISLDVISVGDLDGAEIHSEPVHLRVEGRIPFGTQFAPEASRPIQTI